MILALQTILCASQNFSMPSRPSLRNLHCDINAFVSPVTRSGQIKQFWQMQELTNYNYSDIKLYLYLYSIFHIEYKAIAFNTIKKKQLLQSRSAISRAASLSFQ